MEDTKNQTAGEKQNVKEQQNDSSLVKENDNQAVVQDQTTAALNDESALLDHEPTEQQKNESSLLEENDVGDESQSKEPESDDVAVEKSEHTAMEGDAKSGVDEEDDEDAVPLNDSFGMPQVSIATLAKRRWQIKVYPLKPSDFANGQISRVFSNARESLLYIHSSRKSRGGKGEMYVSSDVQAAKVVKNLMSLDFRSQNVNIEVIRTKNGAVEERAFMRFDPKLVRMLCAPLLPNLRIGPKRKRLAGSVIVKTPPVNTSMEMLQVMFPFAQAINFNPEKFHGTARLVLSTKASVVPCLNAFSKVELGESLLELCTPQAARMNALSGSKTGDKSIDNKESEDGKKAESKEGDPGKTESDTKKEEKEPASRSADVKKKAFTGKAYSLTSASRGRGYLGRFQGGIKNWRTNREYQQGGLPSMRNWFTGGNFGQRVDRNRFRPNDGNFANRNRSNERRPGLPGAPGASKEMIILQSQLNMAIKNQLSMLNQTQFAMEQAKRESADLSRDFPAQGSSSELLNKRVSDQQQARREQFKTRAGNRGQQNRRGRPRDRRPEGQRLEYSNERVSDQYSMNQLPPEQTRREQFKTRPGNRGQQNRRGRPRDRRSEGEYSGRDYGYKRNADMAGLPEEYGSTGFGKRRNAELAAHSEGPSWAEDRNAYHAQPPAFGYEREFDEREMEYRRTEADLNQNYGQGGYDYRY